MTNFHFSAALLATISTISLAGPATGEELIHDDLVVDGAACIGLGCASGEVFGGTDLKIKQAAISILLEDTSTGGSFPTTDWEIKANDIGSGGSDFLVIRNVDADSAPFRIWGDAPDNTLAVSNVGTVAVPEAGLGIGTRIPQANLHVSTADNVPSIRLTSNGSGGFTPSDWNIESSSFEFAIRRVDNTNQRPFRIRGDAPENSFYVSPLGNVGLGTNAPEEKLHIVTVAEDTDAFALFDAAGAGSDAAFLLRQNGVTPTTWEFRNQQDSGRLNIGIAGGNTPLKIDNAADNNLLKLGRNGKPDEVVVTGTLVVNNTDMNVPDYVFAEDYALRPLAEVRAFIDTNSHLPEVPSEADIKANGLDMTAMQMTLLKKVEELTLYTLEQEEHAAAQDVTIATQRNKAEKQDALIASLIRRIEVLEAR
ncbi:hypothetical protein A8B82_17755 [Sulfitobacter sp. EhC04]|uniref:hypothetical protein n=1 Tax=Sulfitobacter sp. EhC04 TaxID=1849168 RepID=UPI0007F48A68|nr:hypothetical protein [Sulfitobacter sp. EhC04]OAN74605.1 hypothetical protein A8B82_17755 [Sulfitobacter sp. EhC04]